MNMRDVCKLVIIGFLEDMNLLLVKPILSLSCFIIPEIVFQNQLAGCKEIQWFYSPYGILNSNRIGID